MTYDYIKEVSSKGHNVPLSHYGISSASLIYQPETKQSVLRTYKKYDDNIDVLCVMIGINDAYRGYDLGG